MKTVLSVCAFVIVVTFVAKGQDEKSPTVTFLTKRGYDFKDTLKTTVLRPKTGKWPDTLYYNTVYRAKLMGSPTIPISFTSIVAVNGQYQVSPTISIGYGYTWFLGTVIFNENDKITVDPTLFFGVIADFGLQNNLSLQRPASFFTGVFVGLASFSLFGGYNYIAKSPAIGLGGRIDLYTIRQKSLKLFGKVVEVRKHKKSAPPIENE